MVKLFAIEDRRYSVTSYVVPTGPSVSVPFFYMCGHAEEFSALRHVVAPLIPVLILYAVIYSQLVPLLPPYQAAPLSYTVPICLIWIVAGIVIVTVLSTRAPNILARSDRIYGEEAEEASL